MSEPASSDESNPYGYLSEDPSAGAAPSAAARVAPMEEDSEPSDIAIRFGTPALISGIVSGLLGWPTIMAGSIPGIAYGLALTIGIQTQFRRVSGMAYVVLLVGVTLIWISALATARFLTFAELDLQEPVRSAVPYVAAGALGGLGVSVLMRWVLGDKMRPWRVVVPRMSLMGTLLGVAYVFAGQVLAAELEDISHAIKVQMLCYSIWQVGFSIALAYQVIPLSKRSATADVVQSEQEPPVSD